MKVKEESEKVGLKLNIQKTKIMASNPSSVAQSCLTLCHPMNCSTPGLPVIGGETVETVADFIFLVSKITADGDCSHEIKRFLLLGRKSMTKVDKY